MLSGNKVLSLNWFLVPYNVYDFSAACLSFSLLGRVEISMQSYILEDLRAWA